MNALAEVGRMPRTESLAFYILAQQFVAPRICPAMYTPIRPAFRAAKVQELVVDQYARGPAGGEAQGVQ